MIIEINIRDFNKADKQMKESWPLFVLWRQHEQRVLEAWGCDTKEEVQQKWEELTQKEGNVVVCQFKSGQGITPVN